MRLIRHTLLIRAHTSLVVAGLWRTLLLADRRILIDFEMVLVPRYSLSQTTTHVVIEVTLPHVRVSMKSVDLLVVDGVEFHLHAPPAYLLRLTLPDRVVDEDAVEESLAALANDVQTHHETIYTKADLPRLIYNPEKNHGTLIVSMRKESERFWEDLDLLGKLQEPAPNQRRKQESRASKLVAEIDSQKSLSAESASADECLASIKYSDSPSYGLFQQHSNVFRDYAREGLTLEMIECKNPDDTLDARSADQDRRAMRLETENEKFDPDRYLNDLCVEEDGDMIFDCAMSMEPHWATSVTELTEKLSKLTTSAVDASTFFTEEESNTLASIPSKGLPDFETLTKEQSHAAFLCLVDVLFSYAYDHRTTDGDPTVESSWTLMILSPALSWLENYNPPYDSIQDVLIWSTRRSIIYPYLRNYNLSMKVVKDVAEILSMGRRTIIRCLLQVHTIMERSESHYLFNKLFIDPMICWIQRCDELDVRAFSNRVLDAISSGAFLAKSTLDLDLDELEQNLLSDDDSDDTKDESSSEEQSDSPVSSDKGFRTMIEEINSKEN